jgi:hypothetical protein
MIRHLLAATLVVASLPAPARASLGGTADTVDADRVKMKGALLQIVRGSGYTVHELRSGAGTVVREFVAPDGTVFGVAWQGPWVPNLRVVLGSYFDQYQQAMARRTGKRRRGPITIDTPQLVVQLSGRQRAFRGRAYVPRLVPAGVEAAAIR